jgi:hypothetical protein
MRMNIDALVGASRRLSYRRRVRRANGPRVSGWNAIRALGAVRSTTRNPCRQDGAGMTRLNTDYFDIPEHPPSRSDSSRTYRPSPRRCFFCGHGMSIDAPMPGDRRSHPIARPEWDALMHLPK